VSIECIDGLPVINPYGLKDWLSKNMSRTAEAWAAVHNVSKKAPFLPIEGRGGRHPQVTHIDEGNFYFAFSAKGGSASGGDEVLLDQLSSPPASWPCPGFLSLKPFLQDKIWHQPAT